MRGRVAVVSAVPFSLLAAAHGGLVGELACSATLAVLAVLLMRAGRRQDLLARTRLLLLCALGASFTASITAVAWTLLTGHPPSRPWPGDAIGIGYVPLAVAGLVCVPQVRRRTGHRARAIADGAVAGASLWYLLSLLDGPTFDGAAFRAMNTAYSAGDVCIIATVLVVLTRSVANARPLLVWIAGGLTLVAADDVWKAVSDSPAWGPPQRVLLQLGLLMLAGAGTRPPITAAEGRIPVGRRATLLAAVPFLPLAVAIGHAGYLAVTGEPVPARQVGPALAVMVALVCRQLAASRDKERLVESLVRREQELEDALRVDGLTGLANRLGLMERLDVVFADARQAPVALVVIDLNDFKVINDNHGHPMGDAVVREVARRLQRAVRGDDLVARLGGDEFAIVAPRLGEQDRDALTGRLDACFVEPVTTGATVFRVSASIGIVSGTPGDTPEVVLAHADAAMYEAKAHKKRGSNIAILAGAARERASARLRIRDDLASPRLEQFHVVYQPVVDLATGRIRGLEALLRWTHPLLGPISPEVFVPLAEQARTVEVIGDFVLETTLRDLAAIRDAAPRHRLAAGVNVSPRQLADPDFALRALELLDRYALPHDQLVLEITEQAFVEDLDPVERTVRALVAAEVSVAVDDFGTGYSTLRYLRQLPLDVLKIDRSYIADVAADDTCATLVTSLAGFATSLGLQVVAEGIETLDQLRFLQQMNCELGQGYLFSPPRPLAAVERLVVSGHAYPVGADAADVLPRPRGPLPRIVERTPSADGS